METLSSTTSSTSVLGSFWRYLIPRPARLGLALGATAPDFALWDATHQRTVRLANWRGKQPVVLAFTRIFAEGIYCPFSYPHIVAMNGAYQAFRDAGSEVFLITSLSPRQGLGLWRICSWLCRCCAIQRATVFVTTILARPWGHPCPRSLC